MKPESVPLQIFADLLAIPAALTGFILLLLLVLLWENFDFGSLWHWLVFSVTAIAPFLTLKRHFIYLRRPTWSSFVFSLAGSALIGLTFLLLNAPLSRGLIH
jgi:hypothetical protein